MPRPSSPDLVPEIWLPDNTSEESQLQSQLRSNKKFVRVYDKDPAKMSFIFSFIHFDPNYLGELIEMSSVAINKLDMSILFALMRTLRAAKVEPSRDENGPIKDSGQMKMRLVTLGCRAFFGSEEQLAKLLGRSRSYISKQFKLLKEANIIVRHRHGWVDLNADLVWKGSQAYQIAYVNAHPQPYYVRARTTQSDD